MKQAKSTFIILNSSEEPYSETEGGRNLTSGIYTTEYSGDLQGRSILMELKNYTTKSSASVYGLERVTGTLDGKSGSFVVEHIGIYNSGMIVSTRTIVANSATDELKGLKGKANFEAFGSERFEITFEYSFE